MSCDYDLSATDVDAIRDAMADDGFEFDDPDAIRTDYSGRGMYGATCLGFVGGDCTRFVFELAVHLARIDEGLLRGVDPELDTVREALHGIGAPSTDSMGRTSIFYWPNITVRAAVEA